MISGSHSEAGSRRTGRLGQVEVDDQLVTGERPPFPIIARDRVERTRRHHVELGERIGRPTFRFRAAPLEVVVADEADPGPQLRRFEHEPLSDGGTGDHQLDPPDVARRSGNVIDACVELTSRRKHRPSMSARTPSDERTDRIPALRSSQRLPNLPR
jgi:hypothetical protein